MFVDHNDPIGFSTRVRWYQTVTVLQFMVLPAVGYLFMVDVAAKRKEFAEKEREEEVLEVLDFHFDFHFGI